MKDDNFKIAFIKYLAENPELRFFQALSNFTNYSFIGTADSPIGNGFKDLWNVEADKIDWVGKGE